MPWNLSQNFINNQQSNGMMTLKGIGDPSRGYGGYSYLKLPLKMSQDSLNKETVASKSVTGTEADLRTLSKEQIHEFLIGFGYDKQFDIKKIGRWDGVKILRDHSSKAASFGVAGTFKKFARGSRMTSKMQREGYQDQIDEIFDTQLKYIANPDPEIESGSDIESSKEEEGLKTMMKDSVQKGMKSSQKEAESKEEDKDENSMGDIKTYLESDKVKEINSIHDIPGYNKEFRENMKDFVDSFKEGSHECTVLKKVITSINSTTNKPEKRVVYIFDDRHIKSFRKRIEKCKGKRRTKPKKNIRDNSVFGLSRSKNDNSNISFRLAPDIDEGDNESYRSGLESSKFSLRKDKKENKISLKIIGEERKEEDDDQDYGKFSLHTGDASVRNKKKDAQKKQSKPKKNNEDIYLNPPKKPAASSRRRQNTPLSQLNNGVFVNLVDSCITFDNTRIFHDPVKKTDFPTYYEMVKNPMDLNKIKSKAKRCEYMSLEDFKKDMYLLKSNSVIFNGNDSFVTKQAEHILERLETLINLEKSEIESLEQKVKEDMQNEEN